MPDGLVRAIAATDSEEQFFHAAAAWVKSEFESDAVDILWLRDGEAFVLVASTVSPDMIDRLRLARSAGISGSAGMENRTVVVPQGLEAHPLYARVPGLSEPAFESAIAVPVRNTDGLAGVLLLRRELPYTPSHSVLDRLETAAHFLSVAWAGFTAGARVGARQEATQVISEFTETLTGSTYLEEMLQDLVRLTARRFGYRVVTVRLLDEKGNALVLRATQSENRAYQRKPAIRLGESIAGEVIRSRQPTTVLDVTEDENYIGHDLAAEQGLRSMICVPLLVQDRAIGVMSCYTAERRTFPHEEQATLEALGRQAAVSIEHFRLQARKTLMQEMHHRVKNNLQQVASLLRLQLSQTTTKTLEELLQDSLNRILAISAVHELLSRDDLDHVSLIEIAKTLGQHQRQSFVNPSTRIQFLTTGDDVFLSTAQATQVALVLNELMANAVEHGFKNAQEGEVHITIETQTNAVDVYVSNSGDPLPPGFSLENANLGLKIVQSLAQSLGGSFTIQDKLGWTVSHLTFVRSGGE